MKKSTLLILISTIAILKCYAINENPCSNGLVKKANHFLSLSPTTSVSIAASQTTICISEATSHTRPSITFTATPEGLTSTPSYSWKKNGVTVRTSSNDTYLTTNYLDGDVFTCEMSYGSGLYTETSNAITITITNSTEVTATACSSYTFHNTTYTSTNVYTLIDPSVATSGCDSFYVLRLTILPKPSKPSIISANTEVCSFVGDTSNYSISSPNSDYYHKWVAPYGVSNPYSTSPVYWSAQVVSGQGTATAGLTFTSNLANKLLYLQLYDSSDVPGCVSDIDTLLLTMTLPNLDTILPISGLSSLCTSTLNGLTYTAYPGLNADAITGYSWSISPTGGGTITSGLNTNSITVDFNPASVSYSVRCAATSACGTRAARSLSVNKQGAPAIPSLILQSFNPNVPAVTSVCPSGSFIYRIRSTVGATAYNWSLKYGTAATIEHLSSGTTDTAVRVNFDAGFTSDSLIVSVSNNCGTSFSRKIRLRATTATPASVSAVTGESTPCNGNTYNYIATANTPTSAQTTVGSFRWYLPANASITSANTDSSSVYILFNSSFTYGSITVRTQSTCNVLNSSYKTLALKNGTPSIKAISGELSPCPNTTYTYVDTANSVTSTQSPIVVYRWVRPNGTTVSSASSDSSSITINFGPTYAGGSIQSYGVNSCGKAGSSKSIQLKYTPPTPSSISSGTGSYNACIGDTIYYTAVVPAPSASQLPAVRYRWTKPSTTTILSANADSSQIRLKFNTGYTGGALIVRGINVCGGLGSTRTQSLSHTSCPTGTKMSVAAVSSEMPMDVIVYPNPSNSGFNMKVSTIDRSNVSVIVRDVQGKLINELTFKPFQIIQLGNSLAPGTYIIETRQGNQIKTSRVVKY